MGMACRMYPCVDAEYDPDPPLIDMEAHVHSLDKSTSVGVTSCLLVCVIRPSHMGLRSDRNPYPPLPRNGTAPSSTLGECQ